MAKSVIRSIDIRASFGLLPTPEDLVKWEYLKPSSRRQRAPIGNPIPNAPPNRRRLLAGAYIARRMTATNDCFSGVGRRQAVCFPGCLLPSDDRDHLWEELITLKSRILSVSGVDENLRAWSEAVVEEKTFQQIPKNLRRLSSVRSGPGKGRRYPRGKNGSRFHPRRSCVFCAAQGCLSKAISRATLKIEPIEPQDDTFVGAQIMTFTDPPWSRLWRTGSVHSVAASLSITYQEASGSMADVSTQVGQLAPRHYAAGTDVICFGETDFIRRLEIDTLQSGFITGLNAFWTRKNMAKPALRSGRLNCHPHQVFCSILMGVNA
jgi:hypothetical protein